MMAAHVCMCVSFVGTGPQCERCSGTKGGQTTALQIAIERLQAPNPFGSSLPSTHWDVCGPTVMSPAELATPAYDYVAQCWTTADHTHIAPALTDGAPLLCGADAVSCLGADAAAQL